MKVTTLVFLSFLLLSISCNSFFCSAAEEHDAVVDIDGDQLRAGTKYYITSAIWGAGGGDVSATSFGNKTCPLTVIQLGYHFPLGRPVTFTQVNPEKGVICLSTDLNIKFFGLNTTCNQSNVWNLEYDKSIEKYIIKTNGVEGNPGPETLDNWFKIEKHGDIDWAYKLVYCPTVCDYCKVICEDVGIMSGRVLTLTQKWPFVFKKASISTSF